MSLAHKLKMAWWRLTNPSRAFVEDVFAGVAPERCPDVSPDQGVRCQLRPGHRAPHLHLYPKGDRPCAGHTWGDGDFEFAPFTRAQPLGRMEPFATGDGGWSEELCP